MGGQSPTNRSTPSRTGTGATSPTRTWSAGSALPVPVRGRRRPGTPSRRRSAQEGEQPFAGGQEHRGPVVPHHADGRPATGIQCGVVEFGEAGGGEAGPDRVVQVLTGSCPRPEQGRRRPAQRRRGGDGPGQVGVADVAEDAD